MKSIPGFLKRYFWDVDFLKLDKNKHSYFIIERILEYGDKKALKWLKENFEEKAIKNVLLTSKNLSPKTANFWQLIFGLNKDKILCLKKSFRKKQKLIWKP
jgi:hypothetical protein